VTDRPGRAVLLGTLAACIGVLAACGAPSPSASPPAAPASASATAAWPRAEVQQPEALTAQPSSTAAFCSPCHPSTITQMRDVVATATGWLAIGSRTPLEAVVWTSADARSWTSGGRFPDPAGKLLAASARRESTLVIVGSRQPGLPAAWVSHDGVSWSAAEVQAAGEGTIAAVVATRAGFVAGGYMGPELAATHRAAFWTSSDGTRWSRAAEDPGAADGQVNALAAADVGFVAVGSAGDAQHDRAVSWTSPDGTRWTRAPGSAALEDGLMRAVIATPRSLVAAGSNGDDTRAVAWTSPDGQTWTRAPDAPSLASSSTYAPVAEMTDLAISGGELLAVGWNSTASNGSAVVWTSDDGRGWTRAADEPGLSGGGMSAIAVAGDLAVAVGSTGWPDTHAATVWRHRVEAP
jgi:hypothetical protein